MKKTKIVGILSIFIIILSILTFSACDKNEVTTTTNESEEPVGELEYSCYDDGCYVTGIGTFTGTDVVIPAEHEGKPVVGIEDYAFFECYSITSVVVPDTVKYIGTRAFYQLEKLNSVSLGNSVESIGREAFSGCKALISIVIPDSVKKIEEYTFLGCTFLENITLGNSVKTIGTGAFKECSLLREVEIPNSVVSIGKEAFYNCMLIIKVTIGENVQLIDDYAFSGCASILEVYNKSSLNIVAGSYDNNGELGYYAKNIITSESESAFKMVDGNLFYDDGNEIFLVKYNGTEENVVLPEYEGGKAYTLHYGAFFINTTAKSVVIPNFVNGIDAGFVYCLALEKVVISESVKSMNNAFSYCLALKEVNIPRSVTELYSPFLLCTSLEKVVIHAGVTEVSGYAFAGCTSLTIYCEANEKPKDWDSYWNRMGLETDNSEIPTVWGYVVE